MTKLAALLALAFAVPALAAPESFTLDHRHSFPSFRINHLGISMQLGRFDKTTGKFTIDRAEHTGSVELTIDTASIDMGFDKWNEAMRDQDWFNVAQYPTMSFKSTALVFNGDDVAGADGEFTLLGVTRPVSVKLSSFNCIVHPMNKKTVCGGTATTTIKRSDFGMKKALPGIGDEVEITMSVEAFKD